MRSDVISLEYCVIKDLIYTFLLVRAVKSKRLRGLGMELLSVDHISGSVRYARNVVTSSEYDRKRHNFDRSIDGTIHFGKEK